MAEYVVYPGGSGHYSLKSANAKAKQVSREEGQASVVNRYTLKTASEFENGKRESTRRNPKKRKKSATKRVSAALSKFLRKTNPAFKRASAIRVKKLKGGGVTITPVR